MTNKIKKYLVTAIFCLLSTQTASGGEAGKTATVFNKRFMAGIKPMMQYQELVKSIGTPGAVVGTGQVSGGVASYHWDGGKKSALDAKVRGGRVIEATMLAPNGNSYSVVKQK